MIRLQSRALDLEQIPVAVLLLVVALAVGLMPTVGSEALLGLLAAAAAILCLVGIHVAFKRVFRGRPIGILRLATLVAAIQPMLVIVATATEERVVYGTASGLYSHHDGAFLVMAALVIFHAAALGAALLLGKAGTGNVGTWRQMFEGFSIPFLRAAGIVGIVLAVNRASLLFLHTEMPGPVVYSARLFAGYFMPTSLLVGVGLRRGLVLPAVAALLTAAVSPLLIVAGSRGEGLMPLTLLTAGYLLASPMPRARMIRIVAVSSAVFAAAMYVGGTLRQDERGRSGAATMERMADLEAAMARVDDTGSFSQQTVRRLISNSLHAVVTRIPSEVPFETGGVVKVPVEFLERFLPRFNLRGVSETEIPRNWMLNELGFLVNWNTAVELTVVADAWYRGGFLALIAVGFIWGLAVQLTEDWLYRRIQRRPEYSAVIFFLVSGILTLEGRDVVHALRLFTYLGLAGLSLVALARLLRVRVKVRGRQYAEGDLARAPGGGA